jgi:hypothetical protein
MLCTSHQISFGWTSQEDRSAGHIVRIRECRGAYRIVVGRPEGRNDLEDPGVDGRIILKWILERLGGGRRLD